MICVVIIEAGTAGFMHRPPLNGSVWQSDSFSGRLVVPVSTVAVSCALAPALNVASAKAPMPLVPGIFMIPSPVGVATRAMMSGVGAEEAVSNSVLSPDITGAGSVFEHPKMNCTSLAVNAAVGVRTTRKSWRPFGRIDTGDLERPWEH